LTAKKKPWGKNGFFVFPGNGVLKKSKSINRKGRKDSTQRTQRPYLQYLDFAHFADTLRALRLKRTFSTPPA
jgi:hypothetical protein